MAMLIIMPLKIFLRTKLLDVLTTKDIIIIIIIIIWYSVYQESWILKF